MRILDHVGCFLFFLLFLSAAAVFVFIALVCSLALKIREVRN